MLDVILKRFDRPDETRTFLKGKFDLVRIGCMVIGCATYDPAGNGLPMSAGPPDLPVAPANLWAWSSQGKAVAAMADGQIFEMEAGDLFFIRAGPR